MTVIITDAHYRMSLALVRDLGERGVKVVCCDGDNVGPPVGFASKYCALGRLLPKEGLMLALYDLCREVSYADREKPVLLPVGARVLGELAKPAIRERFSQVAGLCVPPLSALMTLNDKFAVAELGRELEIPVPEAFDLRTARFPCVVKPYCGEKFGLSAARRYAVVEDRKRLEAVRAHFVSVTDHEVVIQEYLPGEGRGCSVIAEEGRIRRILCHRRIREHPASGGPSSCCESARDPVLEEYTARIIERTRYSGPCMVEFKLDGEGRPRLLEVNPRVWGSYPLTRAAGAGFSWEWFRLAWNSAFPDRALPPEDVSPVVGKRMSFALSDLAAGWEYVRAGQLRRGAGALGDALSPRVADGVWEWRDRRPGLAYAGSLLRRRGS